MKEDTSIAIMQPYFMPYLPYFQLIEKADIFISYGDVNYIKQGWINRNSIIQNGKPDNVVIPLKQISSNKKIYETLIDHVQFPYWKKKFMKMLQFKYSKSDNYDEILAILSDGFEGIHEGSDIASLNYRLIVSICKYMGITTEIKDSREFSNEHLKGVERIFDICKKENAMTYINAAGGRELYNKEQFNSKGINLKFIAPKFDALDSIDKDMVKSSILDLLFRVNKDIVVEYLNSFEVED